MTAPHWVAVCAGFASDGEWSETPAAREESIGLCQIASALRTHTTYQRHGSVLGTQQECHRNAGAGILASKLRVHRSTVSFQGLSFVYTD